jgi:hypothetical protein
MGGFNSCFNWRLANLALQHKLGLLPKRRFGLDPDHSVGTCSHRKIKNMSAKTETQIDQAGLNLKTATDTMHSPEQNARMIMEIFVQHFKLLTGESLLASKLSGVWYDKQKSAEDLVRGLEYAKAHEWLIGLDEAFRLTEAGYVASRKEAL